MFSKINVQKLNRYSQQQSFFPRKPINNLQSFSSAKISLSKIKNKNVRLITFIGYKIAYDVPTERKYGKYGNKNIGEAKE